MKALGLIDDSPASRASLRGAREASATLDTSFVPRAEVLLDGPLGTLLATIGHALVSGRMRIQLDDLSTLAVCLELPSDGESRQFVQVESALHVRGELAQGADGVEVRNANAEQLTVRELRLCFGAVVLRSAASLVLQGIELGFSVTAEALQLNVRAEEARCVSLTLEVGALAISAEVVMDGLTLTQAGD